MSKKCHVESEGIFWDMNRDEEIRLLHEKLDYYTMEAEDDQFDAEKVVRLLKRLRELEPQIEAELEADKVVKDFWQSVDELKKEEQIIGERNL